MLVKIKFEMVVKIVWFVLFFCIKDRVKWFIVF